MLSSVNLDWSLVIGIVGVAIAAYQTLAMQKVRQVSERKSMERCRFVFSLVKALMKDSTDACRIIESECIHGKRPACAVLSAKVNSIQTSAQSLATFCQTLNQEHKDEFGSLVDGQLTETLRNLNCLPASQNPSRP